MLESRAPLAHEIDMHMRAEVNKNTKVKKKCLIFEISISRKILLIVDLQNLISVLLPNKSVPGAFYLKIN